MSTFDIFIKGINPNSLNDADEVVKLASEYLKLEIAQVEKLLNASGNNCLQRGISEETAKEYQINLAKIGIVAVYKPGVVATGFSLVAKDEEEGGNDNALTCPNCGHIHTLVANQDKPKDCEKCGVHIEKAHDLKKRQDELESIKANILKAQQTKEFFDNKQQQEAAEERRKDELEKLAIAELQKGKKNQLFSRYKNIAVFSGAAILVGGLSFALTSTLNKPSPASAETPVVAEAEKTDTATTPDGKPAQTDSAAPDNNGKGISMKEGAEKANKVLNSVGLDANAMASNSGGSSGPDPEVEKALSDSVNGSATPANQPTTTANADNPAVNNSSDDILLANNPVDKTNQATVASTLDASAPKAEQTVAANDNALVTKDIKTAPNTLVSDNLVDPATISTQPKNAKVLSMYGDNPDEWDIFINQGVSKLVKKNALPDALNLALHIKNIDHLTKAVDTLISQAQKTKQSAIIQQTIDTLRTKANALLIEQQIEYLAKVGAVETRVLGSNALLQEAEKFYGKLTEPEAQLNASLQIAVNYSKADNAESANRYFELTTDLLKKINSPQQQVIGRTRIARVYFDAGSQSTALQWLKTTANLTEGLTDETRQEVIASYAYINELRACLDQIKRSDADQQAKIALTAVEASLKSKLYANANTIAKEISDPLYQSIAFNLIAGHDHAPTNLNSAEASLSKMTNPSEQAVVNSMLARQYNRLVKQNKAKELATKANQQLMQTDASDKDTIAVLISKNLARSMQINPAKELLATIQNSDLKDRTNSEISKAEEVGNLLKLL